MSSITSVSAKKTICLKQTCLRLPSQLKWIALALAPNFPQLHPLTDCNSRRLDQDAFKYIPNPNARACKRIDRNNLFVASLCG